MQMLISKVWALEGSRTGEKFVCNHAQRIDVSGFGSPLMPPLFRCRVRGRQCELACSRSSGRACISINTAISQAPASVEEQDVLWLDVAVDPSTFEAR